MRIYSLFLILIFVLVRHFSFSQEITAEQQEMMNKTVHSINNYQNIPVDSIHFLYIEVYPNAFDREVRSIDTVDITNWKHLESISMRARRGANSISILQFFKKLEPQLVKLLNIRKVYFFNLNLYKIPPTIFKIRELESLEVYANPIFNVKELFDGLDSLKNLSDLSLRECRLTYIPNNIENLKKLRKLNLSENRLKELPASMRFLTELEVLDISQNRFVEFPYVVLELKNLKTLSLNFNSLTEEEKEIPLPAFNGNQEDYEREVEEYNEKLRKVREDKPEKTLPKRIKELSSLEQLSITSSQLKNLPKELQFLDKLESLSINSSLFSTEKDTNLFQILKNLNNLKHLHLGSNSFKQISNEICNLTSLESLGLSNNQLTNIPKNIGNLKSLTSLDLGYNKLVSIRKSIGNLSSLKCLDLGYNQLTNLPKSIKKLQKLETLILWENNISKEEQDKIRKWLPNTKIYFNLFD